LGSLCPNSALDLRVIVLVYVCIGAVISTKINCVLPLDTIKPMLDQLVRYPEKLYCLFR